MVEQKGQDQNPYRFGEFLMLAHRKTDRKPPYNARLKPGMYLNYYQEGHEYYIFNLKVAETPGSVE